MILSFHKMTRPISNKRIKHLINLLETHNRKKLTAEINQETVSFTTDHWTSVANQKYSALTAHWIDKEWTMNSVSLGIGR